MGNLWSRPVSWLKGLFAKKALEEPVQPVIPEVDFAPAVEAPPPVVMLEGVVPMVPDAPPPSTPAPLIDLSWEDIGEAADQALPTEPLEFRDDPAIDEAVERAFFRSIELEPTPVEPEPPAPMAPVALEPDPVPEPPQEPVQAEAAPAPIMARVEPVPEPAVPDQSEGWLARLWDKVGPAEGEGLAAPAKIAPLLVDPLEDQPVPNWVGGGQLGYLCARVSMGGI